MTTTPSSLRRTRSVLTALACATALAATAVSTPILLTSANAEAPSSTTPSQHRHPHRVVHQDARRDVLLFTEKTQTSRPVPRDRATDITTTVVDHRAHRLVVQARVRHLTRSDYRFLISEILAADGTRYELDVDYSVHPIDGRVSLTRSASGAEVKCPGASWSIDRRADRIAASVPTSCLGGPRWVRVGVALVGGPLDLRTSWADESRARGRVGDQHLRLGPRQPRA